MDRACGLFAQARAEVVAAGEEGSGDAASAARLLNDTLVVSHRVMADLVPLVPAELRSDVILLRDYYQSELDSGWKAETPDAVSGAEDRLQAWYEPRC